MPTTVSTCLWYLDAAEEAARFYVGLVPGSEIENITRVTPEAPALVVDFTLAGARYQALNGGKGPRFNQAASIVVMTEDQAETDRLWAALTADGGAEQQCGWLKDRFGLSWQIIPQALPRLIAASDPAAAARVTEALMSMKKLDIAALEAAHRGA